MPNISLFHVNWIHVYGGKTGVQPRWPIYQPGDPGFKLGYPTSNPGLSVEKASHLENSTGREYGSLYTSMASEAKLLAGIGLLI